MVELERIIAGIHTDLAASPDAGGDLPHLGKPAPIEEFAPREKLSLEQLLELMRRELGREQNRDLQLFASPSLAIMPLQPIICRSTRLSRCKRPRVGRATRMRTPSIARPSASRCPIRQTLKKRIDFLRIASALGQHPHLIRLTGLVVPPVGPAQISLGDQDLSVEVRRADDGVQTERDVLPATRITLTGRSFQAKPRDAALLEGGWL
ncbi:hypothetical protein [Mesorhizobium sp. M1136]|uniref:hypothetical protein n=1 Tax=Mesorhizobium sp. M1136 TaxID=2957059 RepID=UPI00333B7ABA